MLYKICIGDTQNSKTLCFYPWGFFYKQAELVMVTDTFQMFVLLSAYNQTREEALRILLSSKYSELSILPCS